MRGNRKKVYNYRKKAQSILDYMLLLIIIIAGLAVIGYYIRNVMSGKLREAADVFGGGEVYYPNVTVVK